MKRTIWTIGIFVCGIICIAAKSLVLIDETGATKKNIYADYNLKQWDIASEEDKVKKAIAVFKRKSSPRYEKRVWIAHKKNSEKKILIEYTSEDKNDKIIFSPDEEFVYYSGLSWYGAPVIYGLNLLNEQKFIVDSSDTFTLETCKNKKSYIVVQKKDGDATIYNVYNLKGGNVDAINSKTPIDIKKYICY